MYLRKVSSFQNFLLFLVMNRNRISEWKHDVLGTIREGGYSNQVISQAIRKSLRGQAKQVLVSAGSSVSKEEIIKRLERVFGNVSSGEGIFQEFYTASQKQGKSAVTWGLRLEEILKHGVDKGYVKPESKSYMLRNIF